MSGYMIEVRDIETEEIIHRVPCHTKHRAERVEQSILINLDRDKYYTKLCYYTEGGKH